MDANVHTTSGKRYDFQSGEVWPLEDINFEVFSPRKLLDQFRSVVDKGLVLCAELLVDDGSESCSPNLISLETRQSSCTAYLPTRRGRRKDRRKSQ